MSKVEIKRSIKSSIKINYDYFSVSGSCICIRYPVSLLWELHFEFSYSHKQKWFSTVYVQMKTDGSSQVPLVDTAKHTQIYTRLNYYKSRTYGITQSYTYNKLNWLESSIQVDVNYTVSDAYRKYENIIPMQDGYSASFTLNNSLILNKHKTWIGEINYFYSSPGKSIIYQFHNRMNLSFGIKVFLLDKRLQCAVNVNDVLKTNASAYTMYTNNIQQYISMYFDNRYLKFSLRYNFGNKKVKVEEREFGNKDEKGRL